MAGIDNFYKEIANFEKRLRKMETIKQIIGADIVQIVKSDLGTASSGSIAAGSKVIFTINLSPATQILTIWDLLFSFYVDTDSNSNFLYPSGVSLSSGQKNLDMQFNIDYILSDDSIGKRVAKIVIVNNDSSAHTYFLNYRWYGIKQTL